MLVKHTNYNKKEVSKYAYLFFMAMFFLFASSKAHPQSTAEKKEVYNAYQKILKLKINEGKKDIQQNLKLNKKPALPLEIYALNLADILELLLTEDVELYNKRKHLEKERLNLIANLPESDPYKKFCEAEIKLQWAFVKLKFGDELNAIWNINQSYKAVKENAETFPAFSPNNKTLGIFNVILGAVPQKYQWVLNLFSMNGKTETGLTQLTSISKNDNFFSLESTILLNLIKAYLLESAAIAIDDLQELSARNPDNKLIKYLLGMTLLKNNQAENALQVLKNTNSLKEGYIPIAFTAYLQGEIMLQKGLYNEASSQYASFLLHYKGQNFVKDAYYKLFISNYLLGNNKWASYYIDKAKNIGTTIAEADKYAAKRIASGDYPNKEILKIRLATDGGFYERADSLINVHNDKDFPTYKDQVEFIYRKARLFDKQGIEDRAMKFYLNTIDKSGKNEWYFAPNAALHLGYIYAQTKQRTKAVFYFEKALSYKNYEYKNSIDHKAEAALQKLKGDDDDQ